jgi:agmatine deiminase
MRGPVCRAEVRVVEISSNDAWIRDCGPTFVIDAKGRRRGVDWTFNAWGGLQGGLYFPWDRDDEVAQKVLEIEGSERYRTSFVLEGGAIHVDGQGTCLTTEECLLNPNRNRGVRGRRRGAAAPLSGRYYGDLAGRRACISTRPAATSTNSPASPAPGQVALTWTDDRDDPQYEISQDAYQRCARRGTRAGGR